MRLSLGHAVNLVKCLDEYLVADVLHLLEQFNAHLHKVLIALRLLFSRQRRNDVTGIFLILAAAVRLLGALVEHLEQMPVVEHESEANLLLDLGSHRGTLTLGCAHERNKHIQHDDDEQEAGAERAAGEHIGRS